LYIERLMKRSKRHFFAASLIFLVVFILSIEGKLFAEMREVRFPFDRLDNEVHSMKDPKAYAKARLSPEMLDRISRGMVKEVVIHSGGRDFFLRNFVGSSELEEVLETTGEGGRTCYFLDRVRGIVYDCNLYGRAWAFHKALVFHFCGIPLSRIKIFVDSPTFLSFSQGSTAPDQMEPIDFAIVGYRKSFIWLVCAREIAARKVDHLRLVIGDPVRREAFFEAISRCGESRNIPGKLDSANGERLANNSSIRCLELPELKRGLDTLLSLSHEDLFRKSRNYFLLRQIEKSMKKLFQKSKDIPLIVSQVFTPNGFIFQDHPALHAKNIGKYFKKPFEMTRFSVILKSGRKAALMVTKNPYGDVLQPLAFYLKRIGAKTVLFTGSSGSLDPHANIGDVVVPTTMLGLLENGSFSPPRKGNSIAEFCSREKYEGVRISGKHASLCSPLIETESIVSEMRKSGIESVDCESWHLFRSFPASFERGAIFLITDKPGGEVTLDQHEEVDSYNQIFLSPKMRMQDILFDFLSIKGVEIE